MRFLGGWAWEWVSRVFDDIVDTDHGCIGVGAGSRGC